MKPNKTKRFLDFVSFGFVSFRLETKRNRTKLTEFLVSFRLAWFRFDWLRFVSIRFVSFGFVSLFTCTLLWVHKDASCHVALLWQMVTFMQTKEKFQTILYPWVFWCNRLTVPNFAFSVFISTLLSHVVKPKINPEG